jgi:SAM-dependent methyltransferase
VTAAGSGPGVITADGCAVEVYAALRAHGEPDLVAAAVPAGASILELGAGAGRVTRELVARGFEVVAVDDSQEMLNHIEGAERHLARIEDLDLGRRFDAVLLCSHLVNSPVDQRDAFVATAARHVAGDGCVVIERHPPAWFDTATESTATVDGVEISLGEVSRPGDGLLAATVRYRIGARCWSHRFVTQRVDDDMLAGLLGRHGLLIDRFVDADKAWIRAVPA